MAPLSRAAVAGSSVSPRGGDPEILCVHSGLGVQVQVDPHALKSPIIAVARLANGGERVRQLNIAASGHKSGNDDKNEEKNKDSLPTLSVILTEVEEELGKASAACFNADGSLLFVAYEPSQSAVGKAGRKRGVIVAWDTQSCLTATTSLSNGDKASASSDKKVEAVFVSEVRGGTATALALPQETKTTSPLLLAVGSTRGITLLNVSAVRQQFRKPAAPADAFPVVRTLPLTGGDTVTAVVFGAKGNTLFVANDGDAVVHVWDLLSLSGEDRKQQQQQKSGKASPSFPRLHPHGTLATGSLVKSPVVALHAARANARGTLSHVLARTRAGIFVFSFNKGSGNGRSALKPVSRYEIPLDMPNMVVHAAQFAPWIDGRERRLSIVLSNVTSTERWEFDPVYAPLGDAGSEPFVSALELDLERGLNGGATVPVPHAGQSFSILGVQDVDMIPQQTADVIDDEDEQDLEDDGGDGETLGQLAAKLDMSRQRLKDLTEDTQSKLDSAEAQPRADSLQAVLAQAIRTNDTALLASVLSVGDGTIIRNTTARLPASLVLPLLKAAIERFSSKPGVVAPSPVQNIAAAHRAVTGSAALWIRALLEHHASYLMSCPDLVRSLSSLYLSVESRLSVFRKLLKLSGRLDLVLSQVARHELGAGANRNVASTVFVDDGSSDEDEDDQDSSDIDADSSSDDSDNEKGVAQNFSADSEEESDAEGDVAWQNSGGSGSESDIETGSESDEFALLEQAAREAEERRRKLRGDDASSSDDSEDHSSGGSLDSDELEDLMADD